MTPNACLLLYNVHVLENAFYANHFWAQTGNLIMYNLIQAVIIYLSVMKKNMMIFFGLKNYYPLQYANVPDAKYLLH